MSKRTHRAMFRSHSYGIFACCTMIALFGLLVVGFLFGTGARRPMATIIVGEPTITPREPDRTNPNPPATKSDTIVVRSPASLDKMTKIERSVTEVVYHVKVFSLKGDTYRGSGSGFMVRPDILVTAAHVAKDEYGGSLVKVFCIERDDGLIGSVDGTVLDQDRMLDIALVEVTGCPGGNPVTLTQSEPDPNVMLNTFGYRLGAGLNLVDIDHETCSYIPGADFAEGLRRNNGSVEPWVKMVSPNLVGITGVAECGNSGGVVFRTDDGMAVGMLSGRDSPLARSFMVPASSIREMLARSGR